MAEERTVGPVPITCAGMLSEAPVGCGAVQQVGDVLVDAGHPVAGEQDLVLPRDRTLEADHRVDPGREARLDQKLGVGAVLAAAIGDGAVDDDDLAVVAQVDAAGKGPQKRVADRQAARHPDAGAAHRLPVLGADQGARAEIVGHRPAGDAAAGGADQRLDDLAAVIVGQPDVEQQVDMVGGRVDVGDHRIDRGVGIRQQPGRIAADRPEAADRMAELEQAAVAVRHRRFACRCPGAFGSRARTSRMRLARCLPMLTSPNSR